MICDLVTSCICDYVNTLRLFAVIVSLLQETLKRSKTCLVGAHLSSPFQMVIYLSFSDGYISSYIISYEHRITCSSVFYARLLPYDDSVVRVYPAR
jgi:hypothetical protein